jgi:hypothetical protein
MRATKKLIKSLAKVSMLLNQKIDSGSELAILASRLVKASLQKLGSIDARRTSVIYEIGCPMTFAVQQRFESLTTDQQYHLIYKSFGLYQTDTKKEYRYDWQSGKALYGRHDKLPCQYDTQDFELKFEQLNSFEDATESCEYNRLYAGTVSTSFVNDASQKLTLQIGA